jgi:hypothetical protein
MGILSEHIKNDEKMEETGIEKDCICSGDSRVFAGC